MEKVFVSGGTGYIALHSISTLIKKGFNVKTSLRDMARKSEVINSVSKIVDCDDRIEFCELDLLKDDGWDDAVKGCDYVLHLASPVLFGMPKDPDTLIKPAVEGIKRCLKAAVKNKVKRFRKNASISGHLYLEIVF